MSLHWLSSALHSPEQESLEPPSLPDVNKLALEVCAFCNVKFAVSFCADATEMKVKNISVIIIFFMVSPIFIINSTDLVLLGFISQ